MIRTLNVLAIATLIGSATAAYSVKYETILVAEKLRKREAELQREKDAITVLQAEWQILNRPARLQMLSVPGPGMQPLSVRQIIRPQDIPQRIVPKDGAGDPLDSLLTGALPATPQATTPSGLASRASTPKSVTPKTTTPKTTTNGAASSRPATTGTVNVKASVPRAAVASPNAVMAPGNVTGAPRVLGSLTQSRPSGRTTPASQSTPPTSTVSARSVAPLNAPMALRPPAPVGATTAQPASRNSITTPQR
ncbi:hypothetical protein MCEMSEM23_01847 [Rhabdaerophilaceae bacterium]